MEPWPIKYTEEHALAQQAFRDFQIKDGCKSKLYILTSFG